LGDERRFDRGRRENYEVRMCCVGEIAMLVLGIFTLVNGAFRLSAQRIVYGVPARFIGALLLVPIMVMVGAFMTEHLSMALQDRQPNEQDYRFLFLTILAIDVAILAVIFGIALATAEPSEHEKSANEGEYEGDDLPNSRE
jgi:hypothetical protein